MKEMREYIALMESYFAGPEVMPGAVENQESETASYTKTKKTDKGSVTVTANADSMADLHDVLKLAGITLPKQDDPQEPQQDEPKAEVCPNCGKEECECDSKCGCDEPQDVSYSTDKAVLTNVIRDKLLNYLQNSKDV